MKSLYKIVSSLVLVIGLFLTSLNQFSYAEEGKALNFEVLKYNTNDTSIANDYFNKLAKVFERNGKKYVQITVNHSHWITGMSIEGKNEKIINKDTAKDERTSEFEVSKTSGKVDGKIAVYINEPVNGKPFKYDHHYNITYKFAGDGKDGQSGGFTKSENGGTGPENPNTSGGSQFLTYFIPSFSLIILISLSIWIKKLNKGKVGNE